MYAGGAETEALGRVEGPNTPCSSDREQVVVAEVDSPGRIQRLVEGEGKGLNRPGRASPLGDDRIVRVCGRSRDARAARGEASTVVVNVAVLFDGSGSGSFAVTAAESVIMTGVFVWFGDPLITTSIVFVTLAPLAMVPMRDR